MIKLIKILVFLVGLVAIGYLIMIYRGYRINTEFITSSEKVCLERVQRCKQEFFEEGAERSSCRFDCLQHSLFIKE
jgi:hypothetical protein